MKLRLRVNRIKAKSIWFTRRIKGAWWVLTDKTFGDASSYRFEVYTSPESWRCTRCGKGFGAGQLVPPPHYRPWKMEHLCASKQPFHPKHIERGKVVHRVDPHPRSTLD